MTVVIGFVLASAFPAIVVYGQELIPGRVGTVSGLFFGLSFGAAGSGAALMGKLADATSLEEVYRLCAFLPALGLLAALLPDLGGPNREGSGAAIAANRANAASTASVASASAAPGPEVAAARAAP